MINRLKQFLCYHDYEFVESGDMWRTWICFSDYYYSAYELDDHSMRSKKYICLKCGKIKDETVEWRKEFISQREKKIKKAKEILRREELAKKMWQDKCCN